MKILFAAPENAWGGALGLLRAALPEHEFVAQGSYVLESLGGYDVVIPTMARVTRRVLRVERRMYLAVAETRMRVPTSAPSTARCVARGRGRRGWGRTRRAGGRPCSRR